MANSELKRFLLVIDPNAAHIEAIQQVLGNYPMQTVTNADTALAFLYQQRDYAQAPRPDLILMDPDLPDQDGRVLLQTIKADPHLKQIPVIVFAGSTRSEDVFHSYAIQGNCYVVKAADLQQLIHTIQRIEAFWLEIVTLPLK